MSAGLGRKVVGGEAVVSRPFVLPFLLSLVPLLICDPSVERVIAEPRTSAPAPHCHPPTPQRVFF